MNRVHTNRLDLIDSPRELGLPEDYSYLIVPDKNPENRFYHVSLSGDKFNYDCLILADKISKMSPKPDIVIVPWKGGTGAFCYVLGDQGLPLYGISTDSYPIATDAYGDKKQPGIVVISDMTELGEIIKGCKPGYKDRETTEKPNILIGDDISDRGVTENRIIKDLFKELAGSELEKSANIKLATIYYKTCASLTKKHPDIYVTAFPNRI